jgi:hypothetical protein
VQLTDGGNARMTDQVNIDDDDGGAIGRQVRQRLPSRTEPSNHAVAPALHHNCREQLTVEKVVFDESDGDHEQRGAASGRRASTAAN